MGKSTCCPKPQQCYDAYSNIYASSKHTTCWIANPLLCYHGSVCHTMVTLLARKQNVVWQGWTRLPSSDKNWNLYSSYYTSWSVQTSLRKCNNFSSSFSQIWSVHICLFGVPCPWRRGNFARLCALYCGICERYKRLQACVVVVVVATSLMRCLLS